MKGKHVVLLLGALFLLTGGGLLALVLGNSSKSVVPRQAVRPIEPELLPEPDSDGARLLAKKCIACHRIPDPTSHEAASWPPTLRRMSGLSASRFLPAMSADEAQTLEAYLVRHARKP